jgi:hypothetical protein
MHVHTYIYYIILYNVYKYMERQRWKWTVLEPTNQSSDP